ncbi:TPA: hypothetical protein PXM45_001772 [Yersinia enterocolitica]|nr:hypothetical protein [Yersinia enterocolitica]
MQPYLVIKTEFSKKIENITKLINEKIFPKVEDFLLISSFIQRDKITCKGWEALYNGVQTSYYRTYMSYADDIKKKDGVPIDAKYVPEFLKVTVKRLQENKFKDAIKVAINALNNSNSSTFELSFLSIFQAIESLVNTYKRERDLEFILPKNNFKKLSKKIRDSMKSQEFKSLLNDGGYESIIKKIPELNRLSLSDAFRLMEKEHSLSFHGLWPLFNDGETKGLVNIRNVFAHGGSFPRQTYAALMTARTCLQFFLERLIFQLLGWPIEKTYISDDYLSKYYFSENQILNSQRILLKYLNSKTKE